MRRPSPAANRRLPGPEVGENTARGGGRGRRDRAQSGRRPHPPSSQRPRERVLEWLPSEPPLSGPIPSPLGTPRLNCPSVLRPPSRTQPQGPSQGSRLCSSRTIGSRSQPGAIPPCREACLERVSRSFRSVEVSTLGLSPERLPWRSSQARFLHSPSAVPSASALWREPDLGSHPHPTNCPAPPTRCLPDGQSWHRGGNTRPFLRQHLLRPVCWLPGPLGLGRCFSSSGAAHPPTFEARVGQHRL